MSLHWWQGFFEDGHSGSRSAKRLVMVMAATSLSISVVLLSIAQLFGYDTALALGAVSVPLAGLGGYGYVHGKKAERSPPE